MWYWVLDMWLLQLRNWMKWTEPYWEGLSFQIKRSELCVVTVIASFSSFWPTACLKVQLPSNNHETANVRMKVTFQRWNWRRIKGILGPWYGIVEHPNQDEQLPNSPIIKWEKINSRLFKTLVSCYFSHVCFWLIYLLIYSSTFFKCKTLILDMSGMLFQNLII